MSELEEQRRSKAVTLEDAKRELQILRDKRIQVEGYVRNMESDLQTQNDDTAAEASMLAYYRKENGATELK
jgi:hypothetical protein